MIVEIVTIFIISVEVTGQRALSSVRSTLWCEFMQGTNKEYPGKNEERETEIDRSREGSSVTESIKTIQSELVWKLVIS